MSFITSLIPVQISDVISSITGSSSSSSSSQTPIVSQPIQIKQFNGILSTRGPQLPTTSIPSNTTSINNPALSNTNTNTIQGVSISLPITSTSISKSIQSPITSTSSTTTQSPITLTSTSSSITNSSNTIYYVFGALLVVYVLNK